VAADNAEVVAELKKDYAAWNAELAEPKWRNQRARPGAAGKAKNKAKRKQKASGA
jgi:hypothetical protein